MTDIAETMPIPADALDDRLGFLGTSGSGKTYGAGTAVERLVFAGHRVVIADPLGVWWGLRLTPDGRQPSRFNVVIFGGAHGDLPLNEHAGGLIGETVAGMQESAIVDLSALGTKAAERRFMLAFLAALYRHAAGEPVHLVFDEADLWAPQQIRDREQEPAKLLGMMETIVRRGRIKGFVPWLISQRPAVINKDVLSQVDGLVAFKLTSSQDRDQLGDWIKGQADVGTGKAILASLPTLDRGTAVVWVPGRGVLTTDRFPRKATFDSSRTPKRGEKRAAVELKPLDLAALKDRLATVEADQKANDPKALKAEIATLRKQLSEKTGQQPAAADPKAIEEAYDRGHADGGEGIMRAVVSLAADLAGSIGRAESACADAKRLLDSFSGFVDTQAHEVATRRAAKPDLPQRVGPPRPRSPAPPMPSNEVPKSDTPGLTGPQAHLLQALLWWRAMGHDQPSRPQIAGIAGWKITSGHLKNVVGSLRTAGLVSYPSEGRVSLTAIGAQAAPAPDLSISLHDGIRTALSGPQRQIFDTLLQHRGGPMGREAIATALGWEPTSGHLKNVIGSLRTLEIVEYPVAGTVALQDWITDA